MRTQGRKVTHTWRPIRLNEWISFSNILICLHMASNESLHYCKRRAGKLHRLMLLLGPTVRRALPVETISIAYVREREIALRPFSQPGL